MNNTAIENQVIITKDLNKTFNSTTAVKSLNLKVPQHSIFGFLGPNGSGKTTTIKMLLGLIKPTSGSASVFGMNILADSGEIRRRVGYLAQDPRFYDYMNARQILRLTASFFYRGPQSAIDQRVEETLQLVGLEDKTDRPIRTFSGGERQRLGIAQAQVNYPDLLILDEPAASLDPMGRRDVLEVMERLRKHTTIFYSTHILSDVQRVSDTVAIMNRGELVAHAPINELLSKNQGGVVFQISLQGDSHNDPDGLYQSIQALLNQKSWVSSVQFTPIDGNGHARLEVGVTDQAAAEKELLPAIYSAGSVRISKFEREELGLEEVFMKLVNSPSSAA